MAATQNAWQQAFNNSKATTGYDGALGSGMTRLNYNGKVIDTSDTNLIKQALGNGASTVNSSNGAAPKNQTLQQISINALNGDTASANYLKTLSLNPLTGQSLWKNYDPTKLQYGTGAYNQYRNDNPTSKIANDYDMGYYKVYNDRINNGQAMTDNEMNNYNNIISKWNLDDYRDPLVQGQKKATDDFNAYMNGLNSDEQAALDSYLKTQKSALDGQDVALNSGLSTIDANSFQQQQQLQQQMEDRGLGASGIAADTYNRALMGNNQSYQNAYSQAAQNKANIQADYTNKINQTKADYTDKMNSAKSQYDSFITNSKSQIQANKQAALEKATQDNKDAAAAQEKKDEFLTTQTGVVYQNGKPLVSKNGQPILTMDWQKMSETQRHNIANENNAVVKTNNDYNISTQKIAADLQKSIASNKLSYAKLDLDYKKLDSTNAYNQDKIKIAAANAQSTTDRNQLTALGKQSSNLTSQITAYQKKGKKPPKDLVNQYNNVNNAISNLVGGTSFQNNAKGGDGTTAVGKSAFEKNFSLSGVNKSWLPVMEQIVAKESSFNPNAQNPESSAHGYAQFLTATRNTYEKKLGLDYDNPVDQITMMAQYIKDRYGSPENALDHWNKNHWY